MKSILRDVGEIIWGTDSRLAHTLRDYINPGIYTRNWLDKKQARYISPVKMFLIINLVYFLSLSVLYQYGLGFDTFVTSFNTQMQNQFYSDLISDRALSLIESGGYETEEFAQLYNDRVFAVSNTLIIIFALLIAVVLYIVNYRKSSLVYHHITMGLYYGGYVLIFFLAFNLLLSAVILLFQSHVNYDIWQIMVELGAFLFYLVFSFVTQRRMYEEHGIVSFLKSIAIIFLITLMGIIFYRFILFWITMASVLMFS